MPTSLAMKKSEVGELRPSQLLVTFGVGSIVVGARLAGKQQARAMQTSQQCYGPA